MYKKKVHEISIRILLKIYSIHLEQILTSILTNSYLISLFDWSMTVEKPLIQTVTSQMTSPLILNCLTMA